MQIRYKGPPIVKVACGADFSMILDCKGALYSFGSPEYGQLGKFMLVLVYISKDYQSLIVVSSSIVLNGKL